MIKFPELHKEFVQFKDCSKKIINDCEVWICPNCKDHSTDNRELYLDCKEIIYDDELSPDGKLQGGNTQCMCYSKEHGLRTD
jgi:hypothetical protein